MLQLAARITHHWGNGDLAESRQQDAYAQNRNLLRPQVRPPYHPLPIPTEQATAIVDQISDYHIRRGFIRAFENTVALLHDGASASQFEKAMADLGSMIGLTTERHDNHGQGPDVLWLLPGKHAWIIEAKSRKKSENALSKGEHGQLLVAVEWFTKNYPDYSFDRVIMHPRNEATKAASAGKTFALTYGNLQRLVSDARVLLKALCESQLPLDQLVHECNRLLTGSSLCPSKIGDSYLTLFAER